MLTVNPSRDDRFCPVFLTESITDIIDPASLAHVPFSEPCPVNRDAGLVILMAHRADGAQVPDMPAPPPGGWNLYRLTPAIQAWWKETVGEVEWAPGTLDLIRLAKCHMPDGWKEGDGAWPSEPLPFVRVVIRTHNCLGWRTIADLPCPLPEVPA